jgi:hypothetical protein
MVDPTLCLLNHSCDPNAFAMMNGQEVSVRTLKPIAKGEEIYISYIDTTNPYTRRQSELEARWFFACRCSKCQKGPTLSQDTWAIEPDYLSKKWDGIADAIATSKNWVPHPADYVGDSPNEQRIAALQSRAFEIYEEEQQIADASEAILKIEDGMRFCNESGLWTVHRQPYAALRDDLIVNLLAAGKHQLAWTHCAKRYHEVTPKLYTQSIHPVRVVQTWQVAMLALYLATENVEVMRGADMSMIAFMLVNETIDASKGSHGENNNFTVSVRRKHLEMKTEIMARLGPNMEEVVTKVFAAQRKLLREMSQRAT